MNAVEFQGVSKSYAIYESPGDRLKELLSLNRLRRHRDFRALQDLTFEVRRGETFCIVGENGSGKSTMLQMVAGILQPTTGTVAVNGRVSALLELGAGFNPEFSGRDNVYLNGSILGLTTRQIDQRYHDIEAFAEIGEFIDQPVKTYSSGMVVRLAFAVAINVDPEILLVDEALAVGDIYFRQRCMRKVHELRARGVTILFVTHATSDVKAIGDRALWLDHGRVVELGEPGHVIAKYTAAMTEKDSAYRRLRPDAEASAPAGGAGPDAGGLAIAGSIPNIDHRHGDGRAEIIGIAVLDEDGRRLDMLAPNSASASASARARGAMARPIVGFMLRNQLGMDFAGTNTAREGTPWRPCGPGEIVTVDFYVDLPELYPASFSFSPAIADGTLRTTRCATGSTTRWRCRCPAPHRARYGYIHLPCRVEVNPRAGGAAPPRRALRRKALAEFTGERLMPGEVDVDLLNEHLARYAFAARLARGKRVLDAGCGAGYGSAELAGAADSVVGVDVADRGHRLRHAPTTSFPTCDSSGLPAPRCPTAAGSFDLVVAFEVIEHLEDWREFLAGSAARARAQRPTGRLHAQPAVLHRVARRSGANPFHVHEFDFAEFRADLQAVFPHVSMFLENHVEGVTFQPHEPGNTVEVRVDAGEPAPDESHFFVAVCAHRPQLGNPTFVYVPRAANVLRERERHIALLEGELATKDQWLDKAQRDLAEFDREHQKLLAMHRGAAELERGNQWAAALDRELEERRARVAALQEELSASRRAPAAWPPVTPPKSRIWSWTSAPKRNGPSIPKRASRPS